MWRSSGVGARATAVLSPQSITRRQPTFRRREPFEQHEDGELQRLAALGAQCRIGAGIDRFGSHDPTYDS